MDVVSSTLLLLIIGSNISLWYKLGKVEEALKRLNQSLNQEKREG